MPSRFDELSLDGVHTVSMNERRSKVDVSEFAAEPSAGMSVRDLVASLPDIFAGKDFRRLVDSLARVVEERREWLILIGGHVVKTGVAPCLLPFVKRRAITAVGMNGSAAIHDVEIARFGRTSEIVEDNLADGTFGMAVETADFLNGAAEKARQEGAGLGETLGRLLQEESAPHRGRSLLAGCADAGIPATVHVALGTDIVHQHPSADGAAIGDSSLRDFRILAARVAEIDGGAVLNLGSAVVMPEVFLKALTVARNLGNPAGSFTAANFDMIRHYRPVTNVIRRPTAADGWGTDLAGHHEILVPLLSAALLDRLDGSGPRSG